MTSSIENAFGSRLMTESGFLLNNQLTDFSFKLLESINLASEETKDTFSKSTRDAESLNVFRDSKSEIIYIDDFFVGNEVYNSGSYRLEQSASSADYEDINDCKRRSKGPLKPSMSKLKIRLFSLSSFSCFSKSLLSI